mgnify:CR=1 FL=1
MTNNEIYLMLEIIKNGTYSGATLDAVQDLKTKLKGMIVEETPTN